MPISCVCKTFAGTILNSCNDLANICVCDHGFERSDLCAEIIIIIIIMANDEKLRITKALDGDR